MSNYQGASPFLDLNLYKISKIGTSPWVKPRLAQAKYPLMISHPLCRGICNLQLIWVRVFPKKSYEKNRQFQLLWLPLFPWVKPSYQYDNVTKVICKVWSNIRGQK